MRPRSPRSDPPTSPSTSTGTERLRPANPTEHSEKREDDGIFAHRRAAGTGRRGPRLRRSNWRPTTRPGRRPVGSRRTSGWRWAAADFIAPEISPELGGRGQSRLTVRDCSSSRSPPATSTSPTCRSSARWSDRSWPGTPQPHVAKHWVHPDHQRRGHRRHRAVRADRRVRRGQPPAAGRTGRKRLGDHRREVPVPVRRRERSSRLRPDQRGPAAGAGSARSSST